MNNKIPQLIAVNNICEMLGPVLITKKVLKETNIIIAVVVLVTM